MKILDKVYTETLHAKDTPWHCQIAEKLYPTPNEFRGLTSTHLRDKLKPKGTEIERFIQETSER